MTETEELNETIEEKFDKYLNTLIYSEADVDQLLSSECAKAWKQGMEEFVSWLETRVPNIKELYEEYWKELE